MGNANGAEMPSKSTSYLEPLKKKRQREAEIPMSAKKARKDALKASSESEATTRSTVKEMPPTPTLHRTKTNPTPPYTVQESPLHALEADCMVVDETRADWDQFSSSVLQCPELTLAAFLPHAMLGNLESTLSENYSYSWVPLERMAGVVIGVEREDGAYLVRLTTHASSTVSWRYVSLPGLLISLL